MSFFAGEFQLPLNSIDLAGPVEEWKNLAPVDDGSNQYLGDLCLSLRYVPSSGKLTVAVLEARKLKKMDITGASDPYVKLKLFDSKVGLFDCSWVMACICGSCLLCSTVTCVFSLALILGSYLPTYGSLAFFR